VRLAVWRETEVAVKVLNAPGGGGAAASRDDAAMGAEADGDGAAWDERLLRALSKEVGRREAAAWVCQRFPLRPRHMPGQGAAVCHMPLRSPASFRRRRQARTASHLATTHAVCAPSPLPQAPPHLTPDPTPDPTSHLTPPVQVDILANLRHPNVVLFLGVCLKPPCVVTEFCQMGESGVVVALGPTRGEGAHYASFLPETADCMHKRSQMAALLGSPDCLLLI
jgi:hypothetical protein